MWLQYGWVFLGHPRSSRINLPHFSIRIFSVLAGFIFRLALVGRIWPWQLQTFCSLIPRCQTGSIAFLIVLVKALRSSLIGSSGVIPIQSVGSEIVLARFESCAHPSNGGAMECGMGMSNHHTSLSKPYGIIFQ